MFISTIPIPSEIIISISGRLVAKTFTTDAPPTVSISSLSAYPKGSSNPNTISGSGYVFYYERGTETLYVWEYQIKKGKTDRSNNKTYINLIYNGPVDKLTLTNILDTFSTWNQTDFYKDLPVFEMKCSQKLPMNETIVPIMKRKIMAYVFQIVNFEKINNNFDSEE